MTPHLFLAKGRHRPKGQRKPRRKDHDNDNRKSEYFHHFSFNFCVPPPSRDFIRVNNAAFAMLERDTNNIRSALGQFAPELLETEFAAEMWELYEQGDLRPQSVLTGVFRRDVAPADAVGVMQAIDDARDEAIRRALARDESLG